MNSAPFARMLGSSKWWVMVAAIASVAILTYAKVVDPASMMDFMQKIVLTFMATTAAEDVAKKVGSNGSAVQAPSADSALPAPIAPSIQSAASASAAPAVATS